MTKVLIEEMNEAIYGEPYTVHPAAELFPLVEGQEFDRLVQSIREHGVQSPVMFGFDDNEKPVLLDGRNRLRAVERLKSEGITVPVPAMCFDYSPDGITPVEWIESQNIDRRHLAEDARAMLAAQLHEMIEAEAAKSQKESQFTAETAKAAAVKRHSGAVTADSASPQKRDRKKSEARTTAAKVANKGKVSRHKAKQAIAASKAAKAGTITPEAVKDVIAGKKKLKDVVPAKPKPKATAKPKVASDDVPQVDDERAAMKALVAKEWDAVKKRFAVADRPLVRRLMLEIVKDERKEMKD